MGTLFDQDARVRRRYDDENSIFSEIEMIKNISKRTGFSHEQIINVCTMLELRRKNDLYVDNGDAHDEQMCGFGKLFSKL